MKKLTDKEWNIELKKVIEMIDYSHEDYEVQKILANLYFTICEGYVWEFPKMIWRGWKLKQIERLHKKCCDLN